jgi:hypothetical protein
LPFATYYESIDTLLSITNESVSTLNDVINIKGMLVEIESNMTTDNMTAENLGISPEYALQDYNITADELHVGACEISLLFLRCKIDLTMFKREDIVDFAIRHILFSGCLKSNS